MNCFAVNRVRFISVILHKIDGLHDIYIGTAGVEQVKGDMSICRQARIRSSAGAEIWSGARSRGADGDPAPAALIPCGRLSPGAVRT